MLWFHKFHFPALWENKIHHKFLSRCGIIFCDINAWMRVLQYGFEKVKSRFSAKLSRPLCVCYDTDWLVCLVRGFWRGNGARGKYNRNTARRVITWGVRPSFSLSPFGLISPGTAWFINKHKTISWLNYQQKLPRRWREKSQNRRVPSIHNSALALKFESLSSEFHGQYEMASDHDEWLD